MDWISSIGGVLSVFLVIVTILVGGFSAFS